MKHFKRLLCWLLTVLMAIGAVPVQAFAVEEQVNYLPEIAIGEDILTHDVFYLATQSAAIPENGDGVYLLRVGRGGPADTESAVLVKIADMTAKYGEDYLVRVRDERTKVENPEDNFSLLELIEDSDFEQQNISDDEAFNETLENDPEAQKAYQEGIETVLEFLQDASGLSDKYGDEDPYAEAAEALYGENLSGDAEPVTDETASDDVYSIEADVEAISVEGDDADPYAGAIPANGDGEVITVGGDEAMDFDLVQQAANLFTGENASAQRLTSEGDMIQDLQAIADVMTNVVVGASVELIFAPGETEKYLEIIPKDNRIGDGDRMFYVILGAPSGTTTNSSASSCAFTILDDEEHEPAVVSFSYADYYYDGVSESVTVTVTREGAMNSVVSVGVATTGEGTAEMGRDYSEVDTTLVFPFGVDHLDITIPVRTEYLSGVGSFGLKLTPDTGCVPGEPSTATVYIGGTYIDKVSLTMAATPNLAAPDSAPLLGADNGESAYDRNNLSTYRTLEAVNISKPRWTAVLGNGFKGDNSYNSAGYWHMEWVGSNNGRIFTEFQLTDNYWLSYYLAGAEIGWSRTGSDARMRLLLGGQRFNSTTPTANGFMWDCNAEYVSFANGTRSGEYGEIYSYNSNRSFSNETRYVYPSLAVTNPEWAYSHYAYLFGPEFAGDHPMSLLVMNFANCKDCNQLFVSSVKPILRPFQVNLINAAPMTFLAADGTRTEDFSSTATEATMTETGSSGVFFYGDTFTVKTPAASNISQYSYMTGINLLNNDGNAIATLGSNNNPSNTSISYKLDTDNMSKLIGKISPDWRGGFTQNWYALLHQNTGVSSDPNYTDGYPTYVKYDIKPTFGYINASVTLRNPYDFPVTIRISGTDYRLAANETRKINAPDGKQLHKGDTLAVTAVTSEGEYAEAYKGVGVRYWGKFNSGSANWDKDGTWNFIDMDEIRVSGTWDGRLNFGEVILEPNMQANNNSVQVRVRTNELGQFITSDLKDAEGNVIQGAGLLGTAGIAKDDGYTYFTYVEGSAAVNGRLCAITATPKDEGKVCVWEDRIALKTYEGNTFYFTAGGDPVRNVITLSLEDAAANVKLTGTLKYQNYNMRTGYEGNESNVPASGAVLAAGSAGGVANSDGFITAGPIPTTGLSDHYLRYIVSVNGNDMVKEVQLPKTRTQMLLLWDFNEDNNMNGNLGKNWKNQISEYGGASDGTNSYYYFHVSGKDPYISVDTPLSDVGRIRYGKIRYQNQTGVGGFELFASKGDKDIGATNVQIAFKSGMTDGFEELIFVIPEGKWSGDMKWFRLDPVWTEEGTGGDILIDYIAFFDTREGAEAFRGKSEGVQPAMLWDFGADNAMSAKMGANRNNLVTYAGETDEDGNDYYTFTATGQDPFVSVDMTVASVNEIQWMKVRAKNISQSAAMEFYSCTGANTNVRGASCTQIMLQQDTEWHEYIINIPAENVKTANAYKGANLNSTIWTGIINWIRLDPMANDLTSGGSVPKDSQIQIDYIAFFDSEEKANSFRSGANESVVVDISSNFPKGVSPISSKIFEDIQMSASINDPNYQITGGDSIPVVKGKTANASVIIKSREYSYSMTTENGMVTNTETENPVSVQLVVYDQNDVFRTSLDVVDNYTYNRIKKTYTFNCPIEYLDPEPEYITIIDDEGNEKQIELTASANLPQPGDKLYLRLVTDKLAQAAEIAGDNDEVFSNYQYSDIFTGFTFYQPVMDKVERPIGLKNPIQIEYGNLPLIGSTGMNLAFPFVSVGIMKIKHGYRVYIGFSPVQIMDTIRGTHLATMAGADGQYWKSMFKFGSPFASFSEGFATAKDSISKIREAAMDAKANKETFDVGSLGSPSWRFDLSIGIYFDFINPTITQDNGETQSFYVFSGMGGYVSVTLGFSMAWYVVLPVVFLPGYLGIKMQGTVMGYLGADFNKDVQITYDDSLNGSADINDGINSLNGGIRGYGYVQISFGVGLCDVLGVRASGRVNMIANWEPKDPNGSWGFYISLSAGIIIDLFLFSVPLMYTFPGWPFGSFEYYANPEKWTVTPEGKTEQSSTFRLREGNGGDSMWLGDQTMVQGAFSPNKDKLQILAADAYERPDSKLITLSDGESLALAFIDTDTAKGEAQRTTLKLATYHNGQWSRPVTVSSDDTADFQPSIAETKDGRLLVAWVSPYNTSVDLSTDDGVMQYLNSMEVYAAFVELDGNKQIKEVNGVADTAVTRITNDKRVNSSGNVGYYDSKPTVVTDLESGDAMIYYIKSGRSALGDGDITDYINPYTNDCVVCYMPYNAAADVDTDGRAVPEGWLFDNFYFSEMHGSAANEQFLIDNFGGQRFLDGASYTKADGTTERYTIPDFAAISYNGLAIYSYTVDTDGSNDTDADKELYLQVYDFRNHETKYKIQLTNDETADTMPQFFRSKVNSDDGYSTDAENTHTRLFWYRDGKQVVYIDITALLQNGINADGSLKTGEDASGHEYSCIVDGVTHYRYTEPVPVQYIGDHDSHAALSQPDFKAVEDSKGNLYVLWTEGVTDEDGNAAQEIFGTGLVTYQATDPDGNSYWANSGWSKPYRITRDGFQNDEIAVAMSGENLMAVHNRFTEKLYIPDENTEYNGQVDFTPLQVRDMCLVADTLEPCGSVETEEIKLYSITDTSYTDEDGNENDSEELTEVTQPVGGSRIYIEARIANNGMNIAEGHKVTVYAVDKDGGETMVGERESTEMLAPNSTFAYDFEYTLPSDVDGLRFRIVTQEMRDASAKTYYADTDEYLSEPLKAEAYYAIEEIATRQEEDGFHARFTVTNTGNAASGSGDTLNIQLWGPGNLGDKYAGEDGSLYSSALSLAIGEKTEFDIPVGVTAEMIGEYGFVTARAAVEKQVPSTDGYTDTRYISNLEYVDFDLVQPMNMALQDVTVAVNKTAGISLGMDLGSVFRGGDDVTYAVEDLAVAQISGGMVLGVAEGTTKLYATHASTGATVSATVTVTDEGEYPDLEVESEELALAEGETSKIDYTAYHEGTVTFSSSDPSVATVDEYGNVTAVGEGIATVTVTLTDEETGETYTAAVTVIVSGEQDNPVPEVESEDLTLAEGRTVKIDNTDYQGTVTYTSSDPNVVTVDENGNVTAVGKGTAIITVTVTDEETGETYPVKVITVTVKGNGIVPYHPGTNPLIPYHPWPAYPLPKDPVPAPEDQNPLKVPDSGESAVPDPDGNCPLTAFTDLDKSLWYHDGIHWALENGVMNGVGSGRFDPDTPTSRAMIVTMLHRMEGEPKSSYDMTFGDVPDGKWYTEAIRWAAGNEIVKGYSADSFGPDDSLTREQLATILYRYAKTKGLGFTDMWSFRLPYDDASEVSEWANEAVCWMTMQGIIQGTGGGHLSPKAGATRAQVATMLMRYEAVEQ